METKYKCDKCMKYYKSYQSIWHHNNRYHKQNMTKKVDNDDHHMTNKVEIDIKNDQNITIKKTENTLCEYCNKKLSTYTHRKRHEKKCPIKLDNEINMIRLQKENEEIKKELDEIKKTLLEMMNKNCKVHHKTLQKMINNGTVNQATNQTINNINNNINIIPLGKEELDKFFSKEQKLSILNRKFQSLQYIIEYVHFNKKYPQFQNVMITNNRNNEAHLYDSYTKSFKIVNKDELIADLIEYRICDIEDFFGELGDILDEKTRNIINKIVEDRGDNDNIINDVKLLLFNNRKIVLNNKLLNY
jgi:hypothetical protein